MRRRASYSRRLTSTARKHTVTRLGLRPARAPTTLIRMTATRMAIPSLPTRPIAASAWSRSPAGRRVVLAALMRRGERGRSKSRGWFTPPSDEEMALSFRDLPRLGLRAGSVRRAFSK
jgi:hypothetical protein